MPTNFSAANVYLHQLQILTASSSIVKPICFNQHQGSINVYHDLTYTNESLEICNSFVSLEDKNWNVGKLCYDPEIRKETDGFHRLL
ncbi:hypothetical protein GOP47_0003833 [Adiantum capillus-veneris]|uniref:Uncharacterized protein n=1 Tax=Adiantum capillus-veneris TaxID=13818 RepID=A0A9D4ZPT0_ADICA|nr:hypothetical protein GOP47_0003833 [Adiantum capillus-veneris]